MVKVKSDYATGEVVQHLESKKMGIVLRNYDDIVVALPVKPVTDADHNPDWVPSPETVTWSHNEIYRYYPMPNEMGLVVLEIFDQLVEKYGV